MVSFSEHAAGATRKRFRISEEEIIEVMTSQAEHHRPSYVLFDVGNVLVHIEPAAFLQSLSIDTPENRSYYHSKVIDIVRGYERGDTSTEMFFAELDLLFNRSDAAPHHHGGKGYFTPNELRSAMLSIVGKPVAGMEEIVRRVSDAVPIGLLSNTNPVHFEYCLQTFSVLKLIPSHFLSYELNAFKPEPEIFARVLGKVSLSPGDILYIDDLAENVEAARSAGLMGHQFVGVKNIEQLFSDLHLLQPLQRR
jgi:HAD superfamily hydrolase (TIGR01509 family)